MLQLAFVLAVLVPSAAFAADLPDWLRAPLGQTSQAVATALGDRAVRLDPPLDYGTLKAPLMVKGVAVGGMAMTAFYQFDAQDRLAQVLLERREAGSTPRSFAAIDAALTQALGTPALSCRQHWGTPRTQERRWKTDGMAVHLTFLDFAGQAMTLDPNRDSFDPRVPSTAYEAFKPRSFPRRIVLRYFASANAALEGTAPCR
jgi:hypothetical protein